jgi:large subunit ribosomal protein L29
MKNQEITKLSTEDLRSRLVDISSQLETLKLTHAMSPVENPLRIRGMRKVVARLSTELTKRSIQA